MTPEKALALVLRYSELNRQLKAYKFQFGALLDLCPLHEKHVFEWWKSVEVEVATQYNEGESYYPKITAEEHGAKCPHCYAAHLTILERKVRRRQLASIKGAMTKATP